jgi:hypothetical protein
MPERDTHVEHGLGGLSARRIVLFAHGDEPLGHPLGLLGLGVCGLDVLMVYELRDEAAQQGLSRGRVSTEVSVFDCAARHFVGYAWRVGGREGLRISR